MNFSLSANMSGFCPDSHICFIYKRCLCELGVCDNAQNHILILTPKLSRLSKISRYL